MNTTLATPQARPSVPCVVPAAGLPALGEFVPGAPVSTVGAAAASTPMIQAAEYLRVDATTPSTERRVTGVDARNRKQTATQNKQTTVRAQRVGREGTAPDVVVLSHQIDYMGGVPPRGRPA